MPSKQYIPLSDEVRQSLVELGTISRLGHPRRVVELMVLLYKDDFLHRFQKGLLLDTQQPIPANTQQITQGQPATTKFAVPNTSQSPQASASKPCVSYLVIKRPPF